MTRLIAGVVLCATLAVPCQADDKKWEPPAPPQGWKAVASKDGAYYFAFPNTAGRTGTRDRNFTANCIRQRLQCNYCLLRDGTLLEMNAAILSGPGIKGVTVAEAVDGILDAEKDDGFEISAPKKVKVGDIEGKEYRLVKDKIARRTVFFFATPRLFSLNVAADEPSKLDSETADTFDKSVVLVPTEVLKARAEERAAKDAQAAKENEKKVRGQVDAQTGRYESAGRPGGRRDPRPRV